MRHALRVLFKTAIFLGIIVVAVAGWLLLRSPDPKYAAYELVFHKQFHRYDGVIQEVAQQRGLDPMVIKAVVWRESSFRPDKRGADGERGLMQITDAAAKEWVKSEKIANFVPGDLFDPKVNLQAGSWLLARALRRYGDKDDPLPFALAEYNAGRSRVVKWAGEKENGETGQSPVRANSQELRANIDIRTTKEYVETVQNRVQFYRKRGQL